MLAKHETQTDWLKSQVENLTDYIPFLPPSEWVSENRYLPPGTTPFPGYFDWNVTPYLKEILDCLSPMSPVRTVDVMKGVQLGFTVGILENYIGYLMAYIKTSPVMFLTADGDMAKNRMETNIIPMMQYCGLQGLIRSTDTTASASYRSIRLTATRAYAYFGSSHEGGADMGNQSNGMKSKASTPSKQVKRSFVAVKMLTVYNIVKESFRHPFDTTLIDESTGDIIQEKTA